jgi:hypothetical protein
MVAGFYPVHHPPAERPLVEGRQVRKNCDIMIKDHAGNLARAMGADPRHPLRRMT